MMWEKVKKTVDKNTNGNYPAPYTIVECVKYGLAHPRGLDKFRHKWEEFARHATTSESNALMGCLKA